jgi:hypothetical protein
MKTSAPICRTILASFAFAATVAMGVAHAEVSERVGFAYDKQTGKFLYSETHREVVKDGRLVTNTVSYRDHAGNVFAEKYINFERSLTMPDFQLVNAGNGHVEGARGTDERLNVHFRDLSDSDVREASVNTPSNGIIDAGFDRFIEQYWDSLVAGDVIEREFLIPSQLDFYTFEIERADSESLDEYAFQLRIKSMFLKMFVQPVLVHYDARTRSLLRYQGISNIRNEAGENFDVRIEFPGATRVQVKSAVDTPST